MGKREWASAQQLNLWGSFVPPTDTWPLDNNFRKQFSNCMGFSSKYPGEDFGEWIQQGTHSQCDVKASVEMNLTSKDTKHFRKIGNQHDHLSPD